MAVIGEMQQLTINGKTYTLPSGGGGTVSSVAVSNATNGGLSVSGSPITSSGTITIGHSNVLSSAQTTQAVYPIKIDKNGHISAYGSAVTITDEKLKVEVNDSDSFYPVLTSNSSTASTKNYSNLLYFSSITGGKQLVIGGTASDSTKKIGSIKLFNSAGKWVSLQYTESGTNNRQLYLPDKAGTNVTLAVTSDIPTNVSAFTNDAGYITSADVPEGASAYTGTISAVSTTASNGTNNGFARGDHVHNITGTVVKSALGTGSGTTKFLREDGSWATPAYTTNTDAKLQVAEVTSGSLYYPIVGTGTTAATRQYDTTGFSYSATTGTTSTPGMVTLTLGNSTASGTAGNKLGNITLYGSGSRYVSLRANVTATSGNNFTIYLPNKDGTVALTSDIPTISYPVTSVNSKTGEVSLTASDVGAAASTHAHGNITSGGDITATAPTIASGDQIIINDHSASKVTNGPTFDGSTTTTALTPKGTWETFLKSYTETDPVFSASAASGITSSDITNWNGKTSNTGTVTSVGLTNATNGGLTISGSPVTGSGSITVGHSNVLTSAQTTQAVYPIKIDKNGHISAYGTAVTIPTVPTNVSAFTNDAGYITTDTNTTYALSGALSSHKFTSTLTAGGSGSGTSTSDFTLAAGTGITITDNTSTRTMTIACSVTDTDTKVKLTSNSGSTAVPLVLGPTSISSGSAYECLYNTSVTCTPSTGLLTSTKLTVASVDHTITSSEYTTLDNALTALI